MVAGKSLVVPGNRKYLCELTPSSFLISAIKPSARSGLPFKRASLHFFQAPNVHPTCLCWARSHHRHIARSIGPSLVVNYLADAVRRDPIGLPNILQGLQTWVRINRRRAVQTDRSGSHPLRASPPSGRVNFRKIQRKSIIRVGIKRCPNERGASARLSSNPQLPSNPSTAPQNFQNAFLRRYRFHRSPRPLPLPCSCCSQRRCYRVGWQLLQRQRRTRRPLRWLLPRLRWPQLVPRGRWQRKPLRHGLLRLQLLQRRYRLLPQPGRPVHSGDSGNRLRQLLPLRSQRRLPQLSAACLRTSTAAGCP